MTVYLHAPNELRCDEVGIAMSQQVSSLAHKMSDELVLFLRTQNMVRKTICQFLERISRHFLQTFCLLEFCTFLLQSCLFRCFCNVFLLLGFGIRFFFFLLCQGFVDVCCAIRFCMAYIGLCDRLAFEGVWEIHQEVLLGDTIYTSSPYKILSSVDGV